MNFQSLKGLIDNLVQSYSCPSCNSGVDESNVEVVGTAGTSLNVEVNCPECAKHTLIRAQMYSLEIPIENMDSGKVAELQTTLEKIQGAQQKIGEVQNTLGEIKKTNNSIKDDQIISLNKTLKKRNLGVESLLGKIDDTNTGEKSER